jgi:hypothetical protein
METSLETSSEKSTETSPECLQEDNYAFVAKLQNSCSETNFNAKRMRAVQNSSKILAIWRHQYSKN